MVLLNRTVSKEEVVMNFCRFILNNKGGLWGWIFLEIVVVIITSISMIMHPDSEFWPFVIQMLIIPIIGISYFNSSYINYKSQFEFISKIRNSNLLFHHKTFKIAVHRKVKTTALRTNHEVQLQSRVKPVNTKCFMFGNYFVVFYKTIDLGLFEKYQPPIYILNEKKAFFVEIKGKRINCSIKEKNDSVFIILCKPLKGIEMMELQECTIRELFLIKQS